MFAKFRTFVHALLSATFVGNWRIVEKHRKVAENHLKVGENDRNLQEKHPNPRNNHRNKPNNYPNEQIKGGRSFEQNIHNT